MCLKNVQTNFLPYLNQRIKQSNKRLYRALLAVVMVLLITYFSVPPELFKDRPYAKVIFDRQGQLISARIADDGQWRFPEGGQIPEGYIDCLLEFEDQHFFRHPGFNPFAMLRALWQNLSAGEIESGGSTISMQVVRLNHPHWPRTYVNKLVEIFEAVRLEIHHSKSEILALYCAHAPYGGNVVGLEAACWRYYERSPSQLSWGELATLAVLPNAPALIHPGRNRTVLKEKRNRLLKRLGESGKLPAPDLRLALIEPIPEHPKRLPQLSLQLLSHFQTEQRLNLSIDGRLQKRAQAQLDRFSVRYRGNRIYNGACLIADVETGEVLAYCANVSPSTEEEIPGVAVDIIQANRSTGSLLKPFLYASMLDEGAILPSSLVSDVPLFINGYAPKNYNRGFDGAVPAQMALARSLNVPAVRMLMDYGVGKFHRRLRELGLTSINQPFSHYGLSLILGGGESSLWQLCGAYASLSRSLRHSQNHPMEYRIDDIRPLQLQIQHKERPIKLRKRHVLSNGALWHMFLAMERVHRPDNQSGWHHFAGKQRIAWKTGTSFGYRDAWAIGTNGRYVVGVWIGNASGEGRDGLTGLQKAAPVMFNLFELIPRSDWFEPPYDELEKISICAESGYRYGSNCGKADSAYVPLNSLKATVCPYHEQVYLSEDENYRVYKNCYEGSPGEEVFFNLPPVEAYYYKKRHVGYRDIPPLHPDCLQENDGRSEMRFIYPHEFSRIVLPIRANSERGEVVFRLAHRQNDHKVFWYLDHELVGETSSFHELALSPEIGPHQLTAVDQNGNRISRTLNIIKGNSP